MWYVNYSWPAKHTLLPLTVLGCTHLIHHQTCHLHVVSISLTGNSAQKNQTKTKKKTVNVSQWSWPWKQFVQFLSRRSGSSNNRVRRVKTDLTYLLGDYLETWRNFSRGLQNRAFRICSLCTSEWALSMGFATWSTGQPMYSFPCIDQLCEGPSSLLGSWLQGVDARCYILCLTYFLSLKYDPVACSHAFMHMNIYFQ